MKNFIRYVLIIAFACISFMFIDDVFALSTIIGVPSDGSAVEYIYAGNEIKGSRNFGSVTTLTAEYIWSTMAPSTLSEYYGIDVSYKLVWSLKGSLINKYDSFSFIQGYKHANLNNVIFWLTVNGGGVDGFIPCKINSQNSEADFWSTRYSSFTCEYDNTRIGDNDNVQLSFTTFFTPFQGVSTGEGVAAQPFVYTLTHPTFFTSDDDPVVESIKEQTDAINKQTEAIDKVDDTLKDSSVDSSTAGSFFSGFSTEDNGGLSGLITAPLVFVRKATDSCTPLHLTAFDKDIELPCGDTLFWNKPGVEAFRAVWNTIFGGAILFMLLRHVFKTVENAKDPTHDKVEVMKL